MNAEASQDDDDLTPEERAEIEREYAEHRKFIQEHVEAGWIWDQKTNTLTHPTTRRFIIGSTRTRISRSSRRSWPSR
jgi:hypothetical protein